MDEPEPQSEPRPGFFGKLKEQIKRFDEFLGTPAGKSKTTYGVEEKQADLIKASDAMSKYWAMRNRFRLCVDWKKAGLMQMTY